MRSIECKKRTILGTRQIFPVLCAKVRPGVFFTVLLCIHCGGNTPEIERSSKFVPGSHLTMREYEEMTPANERPCLEAMVLFKEPEGMTLMGVDVMETPCAISINFHTEEDINKYKMKRIEQGFDPYVLVYKDEEGTTHNIKLKYYVAEACSCGSKH